MVCDALGAWSGLVRTWCVTDVVWCVTDVVCDALGAWSGKVKAGDRGLGGGVGCDKVNVVVAVTQWGVEVNVVVAATRSA